MAVFYGHLQVRISLFCHDSCQGAPRPREFPCKLIYAHIETWNPTISELRRICIERIPQFKKTTTQGEQSRPYPRTNLMISPGWRISPTSSQTDTVIEPVLSATRHDRTTWASFVLVAFPTRNSRDFSFRSHRDLVRGQGRLTDFQNYE